MNRQRSISDLKKKYLELGRERLRNYDLRDVHLGMMKDNVEVELENSSMLNKYGIRGGMFFLLLVITG